MDWNKIMVFRLTTIKNIFVLLGLFLLGSCYSFTGASIPPHLNRIYIPNFQDKTGSGISNLKEDLTQLVTNKIINQSSLELGTDREADCVLEGTISSYNNQPFLISGSAANTKRITIRVSVTYRDLVKKQSIWTASFDNWGEYVDGATGAESGAIQDALTKISDDIFSKVVSSW